MNYVKLYQSEDKSTPATFHFFDEHNRLSTIRALGYAQTAARSVVYKRPKDPAWKAIKAVGEGPQWTDEERARAEGRDDVA